VKRRKWVRTLVAANVLAEDWACGPSWPRAWEAQRNVGCLLEATLGLARARTSSGLTLRTRCCAEVVAFYIGFYEALNRDSLSKNDLAVLDQLYRSDVPIPQEKADELFALASTSAVVRYLIAVFRDPVDVYNAKMLRNRLGTHSNLLRDDAAARIRKHLPRPRLP
jgi:hypothetical protein